MSKLKAILIQRGLSQKDLVELIELVNVYEENGIKRHHTVQEYIISRIVNGVPKNYSLNTFILISNALNVRIDDIVD